MLRRTFLNMIGALGLARWLPKSPPIRTMDEMSLESVSAMIQSLKDSEPNEMWLKGLGTGRPTHFGEFKF